MVIEKHILQKIGLLWLFALLISACSGPEEDSPLPVTGLSASPTSDLVETAVKPTEAATEILAEEAELEATVASMDVAAEDADSRPTRIPADKYANLEIVTLLPRDAIPAVDNPQFLSADEADEFYDPDELVMGVIFNGDARAYSIPYLSNREIVNDTVGGLKIAVTW